MSTLGRRSLSLNSTSGARPRLFSCKPVRRYRKPRQHPRARRGPLKKLLFQVPLTHVGREQLHALAVTRLQRSSLLPELPTFHEAGVTGFDMDSWAGIVAPANTPPEIVTLLNNELRKIIDSPDIKSTLGNVGFEAFSSSPKELEDFVKVQLGKWSKMVKDAGIQPD
jgi:hypothetical protein